MASHDPRATAAPAASQATARATAPARLAVAQTTVPEDPTNPGALRESGAQVRQLMHEAAAAGARLAQFPEGAITYPGKYVMSSAGPGTLAEADWSRIDWDVMREEAQRVAALSGQLGIWTVFGSLHPLTPPSRPHNSLYIIAPDGRLLTRYDKRYLSNRELPLRHRLPANRQKPASMRGHHVRSNPAGCLLLQRDGPGSGIN